MSEEELDELCQEIEEYTPWRKLSEENKALKVDKEKLVDSLAVTSLDKAALRAMLQEIVDAWYGPADFSPDDYEKLLDKAREMMK